MQHEARLAAKQAGGVDAQRELAVETAFRVVGDEGFGGGVGPEVFHGCSSCW